MKKSLVSLMDEGKFLVSIQLDPPAKDDFSEFNEMIETLIENDVGIVDVNSSRRLSYDSIQLAVELSRRGLYAIPHVTTRDASVNGLMNKLLAAYAIGGIRDALVITGDPYDSARPAAVDTPGVFQTNSAGAIRLFHDNLPPKFRWWAAVNQNADHEEEKKRLAEKCKAGAWAFMSQPVFSSEDLNRVRILMGSVIKSHLFVGIWPLTNWKTIMALRAEKVAGVVLPDEVYHEAKQYHADAKGLEEWGLAKAEELVRFIHLHRKAQGVYLVAPSRNPLAILPLYKKIMKL